MQSAFGHASLILSPQQRDFRGMLHEPTPISANVGTTNKWNFADSPMYKILVNVLSSIDQPLLRKLEIAYNKTALDRPSLNSTFTKQLDYYSTTTSYFPTGPSDWNSSFWSANYSYPAHDNSSNHTENDDQYSLTSLFFIIVSGTLLSLMTAGGNLLVLLSFYLDKHLRTISNSFLFSLGVADLTVGLISVPLMTLYTAENQWTLGYSACQFWLSVDYLMSNASVWNLLLISFDRYFSLTRPLTYRPRRTKKKAMIMIALTFVVSLVLWPPLIITWPYIEGHFALLDNECMVQFLKTNEWITLLTAVLAFYLPVSIMVVLYARVYYVTQTRHRDLEKFAALAEAKRAPAPVKTSEWSTVDQTDNNSYAGARDSQCQSSEIIYANGDEKTMCGRNISREASLNKSWNLQNLLRHLSRRRLKSLNHVGHNSMVSDDDERNTDSDEESAPLRPDYVKRDSNKVVSRTSSRRSRHTRRDATAANRQFVHRAVSNPIKPTLKNMETSLKSSRVNRCSFQCEQMQSNVKKPEETAYTVLIHLPSSDNSSAPSITLYDGSLMGSPSSISKSAGELVPHGSTKRESLLSDSASGSKTPVVFNETQSIISKESDPLTSLPGRLTKSASLKSKASANEKRQQRVEKKQESKAAKTLSAILIAFIVTWTPYNVIVLIEAFRPLTVPQLWFTFSYYLCYINSTVNPVLYALCNANFRMCFYKILTCKWGKRHEMLQKTSTTGYSVK